MHTPIYTPDQIRAAEAPLLKQLGEGLMRQAAFVVAMHAIKMLRQQRGTVTGAKVLVLAGSGNNGGDALYAGAELEKRGARVEVWQLADSIHPALGSLRYPRMVSSVGEPDLIIDGIVGIGTCGPLRGPAIRAAEQSAALPVLAVDIPSGVDPMSGRVEGASIRAKKTVTFGGIKPAHVLGWEHCGEVVCAPIGIDEYLTQPWGYSAKLYKWPLPGPQDHKYTLGVLGVHAGSAQYPGAAVLCTRAAARATSSMVRYVGPCAAQVLAAQPEVVASAETGGRIDAWVTGPGSGTADPMLAELLKQDVPVVVDADALTQLATEPNLMNMVRERTALTVLTPHDGEFMRLVGTAPEDRVVAARELAEDLGCVIVLKGRVTVVVDATEIYLVEAGSSWAATPGSGDVLAGIIGKAVAAQASISAVALAVRLHAVAAGWRGGPVVAGDIVDTLPEVMTTMINHELIDYHH